MNNLTEDKDEVEETLHSWVRRERRKKGIAPDEAACWFAYLMEPDNPNSVDRAVVALGRSPGDVLASAEMHANARGGVRQGTSRWLMDNRAGEREDGVYSVYLLVVPEPDEQQP
jgi:hypothetical protein